MKNLKIKKLLTSLTAIGLAATTTVSVVACTKKQKEGNLGTIIADQLKNDTSVLYVGNTGSNVIAKIKSIISMNKANMDANKWDLNNPEVTLKDKDGKSVGAADTLRKESYSFSISIKGKGDNSGAKPMLTSGIITVTKEKKEISLELLNKFDQKLVSTALGNVTVNESIRERAESKILESVKKQFLGIEDSEITIEIKNTEEELKMTDAKKGGHNFKFNLKAGEVSSKEYNVDFTYTLGTIENQFDLATATITIKLEKSEIVASDKTAVTPSEIKTILNSKINNAIKEASSLEVALGTDYEYEVYTAETAQTAEVLKANLNLSVENTVYAKITAKGERLKNYKVVTVVLPKATK